jgi:hypothetical protein
MPSATDEQFGKKFSSYFAGLAEFNDVLNAAGFSMSGGDHETEIAILKGDAARQKPNIGVFGSRRSVGVHRGRLTVSMMALARASPSWTGSGP